MPAPRRRHDLLIDGHVHLHACFPLESALDAAVENFLRVGADRAAGRPLGALWLVETAAEGSIARLAALPDGRWRRIERGSATWDLVRDDGSRIVVVPGRQVTTAEDLEVLVVGTTDGPPDGRPIDATIEAWLDDTTAVMLPWGFGKWSGSRGRIVARCLDAYADRGLRLSDTAVRPGWCGTPGALRSARGAGLGVPTGSDPFPFPDRVDVVGSAGFRLDGAGPDADWSGMRRALDSTAPPWPRFGRTVTTLPFLRLQARMQFRKRLQGSPGA